MRRYARLLGREMGLNEHDATLLFHASALHDLGKIAVPDAILLKPGRLDEQEMEIMRRHPVLGAEMLNGARSLVLQLAQRIALTHHERWDGSGYPHGLAGAEIPLEGRIVAVCDVFDALCSRRPYKRAWDPEEAADEVVRGCGTHFDPRVIAAFQRVRAQMIAIAIEESAEPHAALPQPDPTAAPV